MRRPVSPLKVAIVIKGQKQADVARAAGISEPRLSQIVRGHVRPRPTERKAIAAALALPVSVLFTEASQ